MLGQQTFARIVGIDPGSNMMGYAAIDFDIISKKIISTCAFTIRAEKARVTDSIADIFGDRLGRIDALKNALFTYFEQDRPNFVICESPFIAMRQPAAYGSLTETVCCVREALALVDPFQKVYSVDPPTAKKTVGAAGNAKKPQMQAAVGAMLDELCYNESISGNFFSLDEHSVDAIAIAKTFHTWLVTHKYA